MCVQNVDVFYVEQFGDVSWFSREVFGVEHFSRRAS